MRLVDEPRRRLPILVLLGAAVLFRIVQVGVAYSDRAWGYDYSAYHQAAERVLDGQPIYSAAQIAGAFPPQEQYAYLYPPFLALVVTPLAAVFEDFRAAMVIWSAMGLIVLAAAVWSIGRREGMRDTALVVPAAAAIALPAVGFELVMGNVHLLLVGLFAIAWLGVRSGTRNGELVAGASVGICLLIKVFPVLLILWFMLTRRYVAAVAGVATAVVLVAVTIPAVGLQPWLDYPRVLANIGPPAELWSSIAPASLLAEFVGFTLARLIVVVLGLALLVWSALRQPAAISYAVAIMVSLLVVPTMYIHYLGVAVVPLLLLAINSRSALLPVLAYVALFAGSQVGLIDLQPVASRVLALIGAMAPLVALALVGSIGRRTGKEPQAA
jgi:hypothetical protein